MVALNAVVVSYDVRGLLDACLRSLLVDAAAADLSLSVAVVDNASCDGSPEMVAERYPDVMLIRSRDNLGFGGGANLGLGRIGYFSGECTAPALVLNPDTAALPGALASLLRGLSDHPQAGVVGPRLVYGDGKLQHAAFRFPGLVQVALDLFPTHRRLAESSLNGRYIAEERSGEPFRCDHVLGAVMLLSADAVRDVGPFDDGFFMYCEEIDWCWRAARLGWETWSWPAAAFVHHAGRSVAQVAGPMYVELWRSRYRLMRKQRGAAYARLLRPLVRAGMARRARLATAMYRAGTVSETEHQGSLSAYSAVAAL